MALSSIPTWSELFGSPDTKQADAGRSITAPAAYLADLLQLLEDRFNSSDFRDRRPDIPKKIKLDGEQSFTLTRQLDIANALLSERIERPPQNAPADTILAEARDPFSLPFEYQRERIRQLLLLLRTSHRDLQSSFAPHVDADVLARERLGLSPARAAAVTQDLSKDAANLRKAYGLAPDESMSSLADIERFRRATQLEATSLQQLLFSQLSQTTGDGGVTERDAAAGQLFINHDLGGFVKLQPDEQRLMWSAGSDGIPDAWFDRVHRLLCLSRWTGIDLPSLDLALRQICANTLDLNALQRLAVLVDLRERTQAPSDVLCALFAELDGAAALGAGDDPLQPASLFDRVFNGDRARLTKRYLRSGSGHLPQTYADWHELAATGDVLTDAGDNKELRARIQTALGISSADLAAVVTRFRDRATSRGRVSGLVSMDSHSLSVLHRVVRLAEFADLPPLELLRLVDVIEKDPNLKVLNAFDVLYHEDVAQIDLYQLMEQGPLDARFWLIQNIVAIAAWAGAASLEPQDIESIVGVPAGTPQARNTALLAAGQALYDAFLPTALSADLLKSGDIGERTARVALAAFRQPAWGLVSAADARLAIWNEQRAREAAYSAVAALDAVSVQDFEALQLGEDLARYLQSVLIRRGVLDASGMLRAEQFPPRAEDLVLEPDGTARFAQIFDFLNGLYTAALSAPAGTEQQAQGGEGAAAAPGVKASEEEVVDDGAHDAGPDAEDQPAQEDAVEQLDADTYITGDATSETAVGTVDEQEAVDGGPGEAPASTDVELHLYPSDLLKLGFAVAEADEWIERLSFLRILDSAGMVPDPSIFADPANRGDIRISVGLDTFRAEIHDWLAARLDRWLNATLKLPDSIWDPLPLTAPERASLEQNLIFNDHIDNARCIADRRALAALTPDTFDLALQFYRHRGSILHALQALVESSRQNYLSVTPDDLRHVADKFVASDIHQTLSAAYLDGQMRLAADVLAQIDAEQPPFDLGSLYSAAQGRRVWTLLQQINTDAGKFRLTDAALASINLTGEHATNVVVTLCADGCLQPDRSLSPQQVKHFSVVSSAQDFMVPQYADYSRDVFFLIHTVAVATDAAVKALTASWQSAANAQETAILAAIGSQIELSAEATSAILKPLLRDEPSLTAAMMTPVLRAAVDGILREPPSDRRFRATIGRLQSFANFSAKLRMTPRQIEAAFQDQQLVDKFPEGIELPPTVDGIDALWAGPSGQSYGSWTFSTGDILDLASLADNLEQPSRPVDTWLAGQLTPGTVAALASYSGHGSDRASLETVLLQDINRLLVGSSIYDTQRFRGVTLRPKVQKLLTLSLQSGDLPGLNRLLLEDAYPMELARNEIYLFRGAHYWTFDANTLELNAGPLALETLSVEFKGLPAVDAVYTLQNGDHWLLAGGDAWRRASDSQRWVKATGLTARLWGRVQSRFDDPANIDGALLDSEGRIYLFCGDQYIRYANWPQEFVDEGYPKRIASHWQQELGFGPLPPGWDEGIDAAVARRDEATWLFKEDRFVASTEPGVERQILDFWGHVRNNLASASRVDAVLDIEGRCGVVVGDQVSVFSNSLESEGLTADEGYPRTLAAVFPNLPDNFAQGVDAGLTDQDGTVYLFRDQTCASRNKRGKWTTSPNTDRWGLVDNTLHQTGRVDATLAGLDGKIYLFSGGQYVRYSGSDLSRIDEGYPRTISRDWGGLTGVEAAFVLDGKTYVFASDHQNYLRYSTRDYTKPDEGYPKPIDDNWWNLPVALLNLGFHKPDAVFVAPGGHIHLFLGDQTIRFDHNHRWWSEPAAIHQAWPSLPFATVSAAFTGRDGRTYVFTNDGEPSFVRYSDPAFERVDDRFPKPVKEHFGKLVSNIERTGRVDAAVTLVTTITQTDAAGKASTKKVRYRYLFSGDQFYRYSSDGQRFADEGYPLRIRNNLRRERPFAHLDAPFAQGIDGVWADTGNVFVFISDQIYLASVDHCRELDGLGVDEPRAADVEEGRLTVFGKGGWRQILPPESATRADQPVLPRALRTAPQAFQGRLSAILRGLDKNVYLFSDGQCYDESLQRQYPTSAAWGHVRNTIAEDERLDSTLMGRDGKLYLFRDDQFVSYTPTPQAPAQLPDLAASNPLAIAAHWGGLTNVCHSFVQKGVTYLLEAPAEDGSFRYVRYFGTDYTRPNEPAPLHGDFSFWKIPARHISRGFDSVDAVLSEGDDLILIRGAEFLHYDAVTDTWSVPRPLSLRWPGLSRHYPDFESIDAVFRGPDNKTYFFADGSWLSHDGNHPSPLAAISARWALLRNRITQSNRVDATLVEGDQTFLFSGDEYVRYTGSEYEYVDDGYPRPIAGFLRREAPFQQLPDDIEAAFASLKPADVWVAAAFRTGGVVCVSLAGRTYALSAQLRRTYPLEQVARVRNELLRRARVDAAFSREEDGALFLLSGDQYVRYSKAELDEVDDGYPRSIGDGLIGELQGKPSHLPLGFQFDLDASLYLRNRTLILFKGKQFVRYDPDAKADDLAPMEIKGTWGRVSNPFFAAQSERQPGIDAAFVAPDQSLYVFKGTQYLRYTDPTAEFVDEGYPRAIRDEWGDLTDEFKAGIDGAFVFDGRTYLCRDKRYVRYGDPGYSRMDPIYPQSFTNRWRASNDFLLGDLRTIQRFVALDQSHPSDNGSLTDFLLANPSENVEPYGLLATLFDWKIGDVQWLKRRDAFLDRPNRDLAAEVNFDIAQVLRLHTTLELARRLASHPQELYEQVWVPLYGNPSDPTTAANTLERLLGTLYTGDDWKRIQRQLGDALSGQRRDALVAWLLAHSPQKFSDARDLSDFLLTDVEMDPSLDTSPIVEATAAIQLYFYRYLTNLEPAVATGEDAARRATFKQQWRWLQNYRVWEANRKVFFYPESYIRPELRSTRTAAFKALQQNLQQGEITNDSVTQAYKKYLDEYTEVSRLVIAGGYVWEPGPTQPKVTELTLFGFTRTDPRRYYYRTAAFHADSDSTTATWQAWQALGIDINSDRVYPVRAFGRTFVFWAETEQIKSDDQTSTTLQMTKKSDDTQQVTGDQKVQYRVKVLYSFCDLSGQWTTAQTLGVGPNEGLPIQTAHLNVSGTETDGVESIVVDFQYQLNFAGLILPPLLFDATRALLETILGLPPRIRAMRLSADLTSAEVTAFPIADGRADVLDSLFDSREIQMIDPNSVIAIGSPDGQFDGGHTALGGRSESAPRELKRAPWYCFDMKGGSFLARPANARTPNQSAEDLRPLADNSEGLPKWDHVDAALDAADGHQYLFNNLSMVYTKRGDQTEYPIKRRWGLRRTNVLADGQVDAAWQRDGVFFLSRGGAYLKYSHGLEFADSDGERSAEKQGSEDGIPGWSSIDAAFTDAKNTTWFFKGSKYVGIDAGKTLGKEAEISQHWGVERNAFTAPAKGAPAVLAAFNSDGRTYLIGPSTYTTYSDAGLTLCETPRPQSLRAILEDLHCSNPNEVAAGATVMGAMDGGTELLFKVRIGTGTEVYSFADQKVKVAPKEPTPGPWQDIASFMHANQRFAFTPTPAGAAVTVSGSTEQHVYSQDVRAALLAADGSLYLFGVDSYVLVHPAEISVAGIGNAINQWASRSAPIASRWGRVSNVFTKGGPVTAALVRKGHTFLLSGDQYVRYSDADYSFADAGYPKPLAGNPDGLPSSFKAALQMPDGRTCYFIGTEHVFDNALSVRIPNQSSWGLIRTNILTRGVDTAYRVDSKHYLFSGNEIASYSAADDGTLPQYMDHAPVIADLGSFGTVRGAFTYQDLLYLVGRDSFICCKVDDPEKPLPEYPRYGLAAALIADLRRQLHLPPSVSDNITGQTEVYALSLQSPMLLLDTDDSVPGQHILRLDLSTGNLTRDSQPSQMNWTALRQVGSTYVEVSNTRYSFRADKAMKTAKNVPAAWDTNQPVRSIAAVWGGRPFDAAISLGEDLYLFAGNRFSKLPRRWAVEDSPGGGLVPNLRTALAVRTPIRGSFTNLPTALEDGFEAALPDGDTVYIFKGNQFAHLGGDATPQPVASLKYDLVRLTTSTAARLNRELFTGGVQALLSLRTQEAPETPGFSSSNSGPTVIRVKNDQVNEGTLPLADHLDFASANGVYLWEIFFHAPALIAGMLSTAQRFEEAKTWYEYIFDPTEPADAWKFLPFLTEDVERIVLEIQDRLTQLKQKNVDVSEFLQALSRKDPPNGETLVNKLLAMNSAFQGERKLTDSELTDLGSLRGTLAEPLNRLLGRLDDSQKGLGEDLRELVGVAGELRSRWEALQTSHAQIAAYLDDPFDPHAIATLRPIAYRRAIVMAYLDNLLGWADMLFGQYTRETINEARMLYVEAWNVLGRRPESLGRRILPEASVYDDMRATPGADYDMLMQLENTRMAQLSFAASLLQSPPKEVQAKPYFFIPPNDELDRYWTRVADRLYKIRHGLNILGIKQPLALFEPPINPMDLVNAVAGAGLAGLNGAGGSVDVPHYRFTFLVAKAQELASKVAQLGSELLAALEKRDVEALSQLQTTQEGIILALTRDMQNSQLAEAQTNLVSLQKAKESAQNRRDVYQRWLDVGYLPMEDAQIALLATAVGLNTASALFNTVGVPLSLIPAITVGLFSFGATEEDLEKPAQGLAMALQSAAGAVQGVAEILGITGQHERSVQDWTLQRDLATLDIAQIDAQIQGANWQIAAARQQIQITERQIDQNKAVSDFYRRKFTNHELYEWMISRLSDLHYQTYQLALDTARAAERSFQFERGRQPQTSPIQGQPWDSQRKGLLAGYTLGLALDRMQAAFIATDARRFEITKSISLLQLDPMAFLKLKTESACEFDLGEALFDYDFPGHYCRQVKTIAVDLNMGDGIFVNATLTQLTNRTIMEPDAKAVGFLLAPKETPPQSIRTNWKALQQIALSSHTQYETNSGVFELAFSGDRFLPFEGTGAVSRWRLELGGPPGSYDLGNLSGVTIALKYSALQGGDAFAASVRGLLKPTDVLRAFNLSVDFADLWQAFLQGDSDVLQLPLSQSLFPNMLSGSIRAIFTRYEYASEAPSGAVFAIDATQPVALPDGKTVDTSGLTVRASGTTLSLKLRGDKSGLRNVYLLMGYKGGVR